MSSLVMYDLTLAILPMSLAGIIFISVKSLGKVRPNLIYINESKS
ncbi:hypothetical protein [Oceanirhabdus sp. W0125-5]|nr:hypothetical protein [Oceanirhabdus sp. W0125-5]WBW98751.1 hypothetical protein OW730_08325 [Oceanirhabdus sp. W0125-5]